MDYKEKYEEALNKAKEIYCRNDATDGGKIILEGIFPELKESEDERMMNQLHSWMKEFGGAEDYTEKVYCWLRGLLEKQGGQKPIDEVESKFKVGDWITNGKCIWKIDSIDEDMYYTNHCGIDCGGDIKSIDNEYHLWTIQDAKDGDVLVDEGNNIGFYKEIEFIYWNSYIYLGCDGKLRGFSIGGYHKQIDTHPATKEQRDLLFQKIHEAGYEWDAEKKELKKIEQKSDDNPKWNELTWQDINTLEGIINNVHYEFRNGIGEESFGKEVLERFREIKGDEYMDTCEQKPTWSEEDEIGLGDAMWAIEQAKTIAKDENDMGNLWYAERWLKSIKERMKGE